MAGAGDGSTAVLRSCLKLGGIFRETFSPHRREEKSTLDWICLLYLLHFQGVGDVSVDSKTILMICRLSLSEVLVGVGLHVCARRGEYAYVFVSVCVCTV
ncbi:unnamed protein product [Urochloa humidicola]